MSTKEYIIDYDEMNIWTDPDFDLVRERTQTSDTPWWVVKLPKGKARYGSFIGTSSYPSLWSNSLLED
jgi:hypothetical protein